MRPGVAAYRSLEFRERPRLEILFESHQDTDTHRHSLTHIHTPKSKLLCAHMAWCLITSLSLLGLQTLQ